MPFGFGALCYVSESPNLACLHKAAGPTLVFELCCIKCFPVTSALNGGHVKKPGHVGLFHSTAEQKAEKELKQHLAKNPIS